MAIRLVIFVVLLLAAGVAFGQGTPHDRWHDRYQDWKQRDGSSCCSNFDCMGAEGYRLTPDGYEVQVYGEWFQVPEHTIRPYPSPDGGAHVCMQRSHTDGKFTPIILCFVRPMGV